MAWDSERHFFHGDYIYFFCPAVASAQTGLEGFWRYTKSYQTSLWEARIGWMLYIANSDPSFLHSGNKRWLSDSGQSSFYWWNVLCNMKPSIFSMSKIPQWIGLPEALWWRGFLGPVLWTEGLSGKGIPWGVAKSHTSKPWWRLIQSHDGLEYLKAPTGRCGCDLFWPSRWLVSGT